MTVVRRFLVDLDEAALRLVVEALSNLRDQSRAILEEVPDFPGAAETRRDAGLADALAVTMMRSLHSKDARPHISVTRH